MMADNLSRLEDLAGTNECYLFCSASGRVKYASGALKNVLDEDLTGRNLNDFLEDQLAAELVADGRAHKEREFTCTIRQVHFSVKAAYWEDDDGIELLLHPATVTGANDRWTDPEQALFISREINTHLAHMLPVADDLCSTVPSEEEERVERLRRSIFAMMRLSRSLQDSVAVSMDNLRAHMEMTDMTAFLSELLDQLEPICQKSGIRLVRTLPEEQLECPVDRTMVSRMVCHLVSNGIKAQRQGGRLDVLLKENQQGEVTITVIDHGKYCADSIPSSTLDRRDPRDLYRVSGMGLGLALTRAFAEKHGGRLLLMSTGDSGLVAKIMLPRTRVLPEEKGFHLNCPASGYGVGIDLVLVEMATVADASFYRRQPVEKEK